MFMIKKILILTLTLLIVSCSSVKNEPGSIAEAFVKHYYKFMNTEEAEKYTAMMAKNKIDEELKSLRESRATNPNMEIKRSSVSYSLEDTKIDKDMAFITYHLSIMPNGGKAFDRMALITVKNDKGNWKVIDYSEANRD